MRAPRTIRALVGAAALALFPAPMATLAVAAQEVDPGMLFEEVIKQSAQPNSLTQVWWLPGEFWEASAQGLPEAERAGLVELQAMLDGYLLLAVVKGELQDDFFSTPRFAPEDEVRGATRVVDAQGATHAPLVESAQPQGATMMMNMLKLFIEPMIGQVGENMHFLLFKNTGSSGEVVADARSPGAFSVTVGEERFSWRTPLGAVLPPKFCPIDGERFSGAWFYCPIHGDELTTTRGR